MDFKKRQVFLCLFPGSASTVEPALHWSDFAANKLVKDFGSTNYKSPDVYHESERKKKDFRLERSGQLKVMA